MREASKRCFCCLTTSLLLTIASLQDNKLDTFSVYICTSGGKSHSKTLLRRGRGEGKKSAQFHVPWRAVTLSSLPSFPPTGQMREESSEWFGLLSKWLSLSRTVFSPVCEKAGDCVISLLQRASCALLLTSLWHVLDFANKKIMACIFRRCNYLCCPEGNGRKC